MINPWEVFVDHTAIIDILGMTLCIITAIWLGA